MANKLMDFLQGASNSAASNVSGPVDAIAWSLRKAGVPVGDAPLMGSDWMRAKGLTREPDNKLMGMLGETFGNVAPVIGTMRAPQVANALLNGGENLAKPQLLNKQSGMALFDTSGLPNKGRDLIQESAEDISARLKQAGFNVDLQHSGSVAGPSSYLKVFDPQTGRYFDDVRFSGHAKGVHNSQGVINVATPEEFQGVIDRALAMRELGPAAGFKPPQKQSTIEEIASQVRPSAFNAFKDARDSGAEFTKFKSSK